MITAQQAVADYLAAWFERDPKKRRGLLERCWADDGTIEIGARRFSGRAAVDAEIGRFRAERPDDKGELLSDIDRVGNWARFTARIVRPDGSHYNEVLDVCEIDADGRIKRVLTFSRP